MTNDQGTIRTPRMDLIGLSRDQLKTALRSIPELAKELDLLIVSTLVNGIAGRAVNMKIEKLEKMPMAEHPWQTYWLIVLRDENIGVGLVGFKGKPDAAGEVEIGYGIDPVYQSKGYMTEAVGALVKWAFAHPECKVITAHGVRVDNYPSQKVLVKNGFIEADETGTGIDFILRR